MELDASRTLPHRRMLFPKRKNELAFRDVIARMSIYPMIAVVARMAASLHCWTVLAIPDWSASL
jgi:hypothetical protein